MISHDIHIMGFSYLQLTIICTFKYHDLNTEYTHLDSSNYKV